MRSPLAIAAIAALTASPARGWEYFEHRYLGDLACAQAGGATGAGCLIAAAHDPAQQVSFGDLTALAGDHAGDPEKLFELVHDYQKAAAACPSGERCEALESLPLGRILRAREFQLAGVATWLAGVRLRRLGSPDELPAWLRPRGTAAHAAATPTPDEPAPPASPPSSGAGVPVESRAISEAERARLQQRLDRSQLRQEATRDLAPDGRVPPPAG